MKNAGYRLTIVEPWGANADHYRGMGHLVVHDDIRNAVLYLKRHDVIMWWQGPEHVSKYDLKWLVNELERLATRYVILAYPYGEYPQGAHGGNPYEKHVSVLYPDSFPGYQSAWIGESGGGAESCVIVWRRM